MLKQPPLIERTKRSGASVSAVATCHLMVCRAARQYALRPRDVAIYGDVEWSMRPDMRPSRQIAVAPKSDGRSRVIETPSHYARGGVARKPSIVPCKSASKAALQASARAGNGS
jgi:hypothetical protein